MLEDITDHIRSAQGKDLINKVNVEYGYSNREIQIEFASTSNKIWAGPMINLYVKQNAPYKWKNVMLNAQKHNNPIVFLAEYLNKTWMSSTNRNVSSNK